VLNYGSSPDALEQGSKQAGIVKQLGKRNEAYTLAFSSARCKERWFVGPSREVCGVTGTLGLSVH